MVSESAKSTGVILPYEKQAINGEELPTSLEYPDQIMFLQLRMLYDQFRKGIINRETAQREKKQLLDEYRLYTFRNEMEKEWVEIIRLTELARSAYRKDRTLENADKLVAILEGRKSA